MKRLTFIALAAMALMLGACSDDNESVKPENEQSTEPVAETGIYQFKVLDGQGDSVSLSVYKGQVLLVVNTATQCGYTPQYTDLQRLYDTYKDQGFTVLDFPCNQFGNQAPGDYDDIHNYCTDHYGITFPQFAKIDVNGSQASPLYVWLKEQRPGDIPWNFTKFVINREGNVVSRFDAQTSNMNAVERAIRNQL